jgi:predicted metal-dependent phosphoesterase TrpH
MTAATPGKRVRVDMHSHTHRSFDCLTEPAAILHTVRSRGIDRLFVTDHDAVDAAMRLHELAPETILVGEEVKTREGFDLIGLFLHELIPRGTPAREAAERMRAQGGVVYLPHPFDQRRSGAGARHAEELADLVDVVEVHNARCFSRRVNERAEAWAEARGKLKGAGSDAHTASELGNGFVEMPDFLPDRESFLAALASGHVLGRTRSSPVYRVASTYAKIHKTVLGQKP